MPLQEVCTKTFFSHRNFSDDHDSLAGRAAIVAAALAAFAMPYAQARRCALNCETQHQVFPTAARSTFVLFGDSITQNSFCTGGWGQLLTERYARRAHVLNHGFSGYNTRWASLALDRLLPTTKETASASAQMLQRAALWTVWLGANDAALPDKSSTRQHIPVHEYEDNLCSILTKIQESSCGPVQIIVLTPPPIDARQRYAFARERYGATSFDPERTDEVAGKYAAAAVRVATSCGAEVIDVYSAMHSSGQPVAEFLCDGLHLNEAGNTFVYELLVKTITERLPCFTVVPDSAGEFAGSDSFSPLSHEFPWLGSIDCREPSKAFQNI